MNLEDCPWYNDEGLGMQPYLAPMSDEELLFLQILELQRVRQHEKNALNPKVSQLPVEQDSFDTRSTQ